MSDKFIKVKEIKTSSKEDSLELMVSADCIESHYYKSGRLYVRTISGKEYYCVNPDDYFKAVGLPTLREKLNNPEN